MATNVVIFLARKSLFLIDLIISAILFYKTTATCPLWNHKHHTRVCNSFSKSLPCRLNGEFYFVLKTLLCIMQEFSQDDTSRVLGFALVFSLLAAPTSVRNRSIRCPVHSVPAQGLRGKHSSGVSSNEVMCVGEMPLCGLCASGPICSNWAEPPQITLLPY